LPSEHRVIDRRRETAASDAIDESIDPAFRERAAAAVATMRRAGALANEATAVRMSQLEGGWSRHSYAMGVRTSGGEREYIVRVKPPGALLETDLGQEYRTYTLLADEPVPTPAVHGLEETADNPFSGPFFVMDRAPGQSPNVWRRKDRERLEADWEDRNLGSQLVHHLVSIHGVGADRVGEVLPQRDFPGLVGHWRAIQEEMSLVRDPVIEEAYVWLLERPPPPAAACLVHGDYRIGNCLIDEGRISAILDWELAFCGDPRFDVGYVSLEYLAGKFLRPGSSLLGAVADREWFYSEYERLSGSALDREVIRTFSVLGALMLIAILNTGVHMYSGGQTTDIRMLWSRFAIPGLRQDIAGLMGW
jgi:aminoglycoside phosphotransferase (APT) family kinase protein